VECSEYKETHVCSFEDEFRVIERVAYARAKEVEGGDHLLALCLPFVLLCLDKKVLNKALVFLLEMFARLYLLLQLLLLVSCFQLVFVLQSLSPLLLLFSN
jgi:hypothetical protein